MSSREEFPGDRGFAATADVAALLGAITLPSIEPFGPDTGALAGLPAFIAFPPPVPEPPSRVGVARAVYDAGIEALLVLKRLEDATAACKAELVARIIAAANVEGTAVGLDSWQAGIAEASACTDIALTLCLPERTVTALAHHSTALTTTHRHTLAALHAGVLSYRHAGLIVDECNTLAETPTITAEQITVFEQRLLRLAPGTTASGFASKARRARESTHPETRATATRQAYRHRAMTLDPGRDGMSWLTLHIPTISAEAIWVHATRTARTIKHNNTTGPGNNNDGNGGKPGRGSQQSDSGSGEHRTLAQLRVDVATTLLLNQQPLPTPASNTDNGHTGHTGHDNAGAGKNHSGSNASHGDASTGGMGSHSNDTDGSEPRNQAGDVLFGANSAFGVSLIEEAPPWAHRNPTNDDEGTDDTDTEGAKSTKPADNKARSVTPTDAPITKPRDAQHRPDSAGASTGASGSDGNTTTTGNKTMKNSPRAGQDADPDAAEHPAGAGHPDRVEHDGGEPPEAGVEDVPVVGELLSDGSGYIDGVVDGIPEHPEQDYLDQLEAIRTHHTITDPPMPKALVLVTVPFLSALNITDEPGELVGTGPVPAPIARKLLANSTTFLRVLTDPVTDEPLAMNPTRYTIRETEKAVLRALAGGCYIPNCPNPVMDTDTDHLKAFEHGGETTLANQRPACKRHHHLKHFTDDKDQHGNYRREHDPQRTTIRLRGWKPLPANDGTTAWLSPSGTYHPPQYQEPRPPAFPKWLKKKLNNALNTNLHTTAPTTNPTHTSPLEQFLITYTHKHHK
ncbi:HNH endonuclease signature motif containing protein [Arthrobacter sp. H35-D1]|uniref:HNH endonuclease signature motif containing protein n=1 Tax=Arthrobacter sp. H35-D1 TaxID=3046202 RepID=UPI0024BA2252|nr:HNH endonuclease signature motif containing protein [Arthrobacter sp. H35-D1]MDJ0311971.1 hypothetical protein [Arthrobacter sp. H35-D1]